MGRKVVSIHDFEVALDLLERAQNRIGDLVRTHMEFMETYLRYMNTLARAVGFIDTLDWWIKELKEYSKTER